LANIIRSNQQTFPPDPGNFVPHSRHFESPRTPASNIEVLRPAVTACRDGRGYRISGALGKLALASGRIFH